MRSCVRLNHEKVTWTHMYDSYRPKEASFIAFRRHLLYCTNLRYQQGGSYLLVYQFKALYLNGCTFLIATENNKYEAELERSGTGPICVVTHSCMSCLPSQKMKGIFLLFFYGTYVSGGRMDVVESIIRFISQEAPKENLIHRSNIWVQFMAAKKIWRNSARICK